MCGICGIVNGDSNYVAPHTLDAMCAVIGHRGPDHRGVVVRKNIGLGCNRLKIMSLEHGNQPLVNEDGSLYMVMNGEIYNDHELRKELLARGHTFAGKCDSETVLHGYEEWGPQVLNRLNGVFALAIWNHKEKKLFLARDRLGVKPLYYQHTGKGFLFASEIKAILAAGRQGHRLDPKSLYDWFVFSFIPTPRTMFEGILKVPPGNWLSLKNGEIRLQEYWDMSFPPSESTPSKRTLKEWCEEFRSVLMTAVKDRLQAHVPIAAFLSGGLDSSSVVALASGQKRDGLHAFSMAVISEEYPEMNEALYQQAVARKHGVDQVVVKWRQEYQDLIEKAVWHAEFPVFGNYSIPLLILSKAAREKGFKVVLTGDGADENLAGYFGFKELKLIKTCMERNILRQLCLRHRKDFQGTALENYPRRCAFSPATIERLLAKRICTELRDYDPYANPQIETTKIQDWHYLNQAIYLENKMILPNLWTSKVDKMCMANGVEPRLPFLDHRVVEFLAKVPPNLKLNNLVEKYLLRMAMSDILPKEVLSRKKHGLTTPALRDPSMHANTDRGKELLSPGTTKSIGLFNTRVIQRLARQGGPTNQWLLSGICSVHMFCERFGLTY